MSGRAVVIGSGAAGLTAAAVLAHEGHEVTLVEQARVSAPLLRGFSRKGCYCDVGLHYTGGLNDGGMLSNLFSGLGMAGIEAVPMSGDAFDRLLWPEWDLALDVPTNLDLFEDRFAAAFPSSAGAVQAWADVARDMLARTPFLNPEVPPWEATTGDHDRCLLGDFLREAGAEQRLIDCLGRYGENLFGLGAEHALLATNVMVIGSYLISAHTIRGGGQAMADAFMNRLDELGAVFVGGRAVSEILIESDGTTSGVTLDDGETIRAEVVVFTPHPCLLPAMLPEGPLRAAYDRRVAKLVNTPGVFATYLRRAGGESEGDVNTHVFFETPDGTSSVRFQLAVMAGSPPGPGLESTLCLIREVADFHLSGDVRSDYLRAKQSMSDESIAMARRCAIDLDDEAEVLETLSPASFERWTGSPGGSAYGAGRPPSGRRLNTHTPVPNLVLAGQSILYPGIMGTIASALVACCHVVGAERVWELVR